MNDKLRIAKTEQVMSYLKYINLPTLIQLLGR
jgi:hypothetical protein